MGFWYGCKFLDFKKSLTFYNVSKDSTLEVFCRNKSEAPELAMANQYKIIKTVNKVQTIKDYPCQKFQEKLLQSRTIEMNKEIEIKTKTFKELEKQKNDLDKRFSDLVIKQSTTTVEYELSKGKAEQKKRIMEQDFEKAKITLQKNHDNFEKAKITLQKSKDELAFKEKVIENETARQLVTVNKQIFKIKEIEKEMCSLRKKQYEIEKEQNDLPNKKKVNDELIEHISNMIEDKTKELDCPVCFETAQTPIYQCTGSHLICKDCLPGLRICPECRIPYPKSPFRNRYAEKMKEEIEKLSAQRKELLEGI